LHRAHRKWNQNLKIHRRLWVSSLNRSFSLSFSHSHTLILSLFSQSRLQRQNEKGSNSKTCLLIRNSIQSFKHFLYQSTHTHMFMCVCVCVCVCVEIMMIRIFSSTSLLCLCPLILTFIQSFSLSHSLPFWFLM
jgi:hypothetical protein